MKHLEKILNNLPKPDPKVPQFQAELRRRVLSSPQPVHSFRVHFLWAAACAVCFATLVLFIANPEIPTRMHARVLGKDTTIHSSNIASPSMPVASDQGIWDWPTVDADQALVEQWVQYQYGHSDPVVHPVDTGEIFAVRKFRLANGRQILVYTALPERQESRPMAFYKNYSNREHLFVKTKLEVFS